MILSVVMPKLQRAQWLRIDDEFKGVDYELIINKDPVKALQEVNGRFVLFLEEDSAFLQGELRSSFNIFINNPSYRKLAMVTAGIDFDNIDDIVGFEYDDGVKLTNVHGDTQYPVSVGYLYGSIIRTSSLKQFVLPVKKSIIYQSMQLSEFLWSNGLRIEINPEAVYYAPATANSTIDDTYKLKSTSGALKVWQKEFIL